MSSEAFNWKTGSFVRPSVRRRGDLIIWCKSHALLTLPLISSWGYCCILRIHQSHHQKITFSYKVTLYTMKSHLLEPKIGCKPQSNHYSTQTLHLKKTPTQLQFPHGNLHLRLEPLIIYIWLEPCRSSLWRPICHFLFVKHHFDTPQAQSNHYLQHFVTDRGLAPECCI